MENKKQFLIKKEEIESWLYSMSINEYIIKPNSVVDVAESVMLMSCNLTHFPIQFGVVDGDFICNNNLLTNLIGSPFIVKGSFSCEYNLLTTLKGAPDEVGDRFIFTGNKITNFKYLPKKIKGNIIAKGNSIDSILDFDCDFDGILYTDLIDFTSKEIKELSQFYDSNGYLAVDKTVIQSVKERLKLEKKIDNKNKTPQSLKI